MTEGGTHVLIVYDGPMLPHDSGPDVHKVYGPLTEQAGKDLADTLKAMIPRSVHMEVQAIEQPPLMLSQVGRRAAETRRRQT